MAEVENKPRTKTVLEDLRKLNERNDMLREDIQNNKLAREALVGRIANVESAALRQARDEKRDDGKPLNTNDALRDAAVNATVLKNDDYQECRKHTEKIDAAIAIDKRMLEFNAGEWKILMAEVDLLVAQLASNVKVAAVEALGEV